MAVLRVVLLTALLATALADDATFVNCSESDAEVCQVSAVRITPCRNPGKSCGLKKGTDATISFDFTPNFSSSNLKTYVYWDSGTADLPFLGFGSDNACTYTTCPSVAGQAQSLNYSLHLHKKLPSGKYKLKWKVWDDDQKERLCCFTTDIKLIK
ncbi:MD-2-related lipid-recognition protein-like [Spodoptera litura]|uniref:MD-2-related lipid-recognition protein-like n=1 Tax=Spodoptera litura TaxID=69820 RepID=A0A9J7IU03_SPOLT|nr:MD-2-related lipid-recognition protein-like [Spodoptera litura]